jgi:hypothetical protein
MEYDCCRIMTVTFPFVAPQFIALVPLRGTNAINCGATNEWMDLFVNNHYPSSRTAELISESTSTRARYDPRMLVSV